MNAEMITREEGERLSFYKLFATHHYRVVIPIIQREYAQGRAGTQVAEVRNSFLDAIYGYLDASRPFRDLDFIYGNLCDGEFVPLDGQQRLTTLFLLHYYLMEASSDEDLKREYRDNLVHDGRSQFTYKTRQSASDFCDELMTNDIELGNLLADESGRQSLALTIRNQSWFFRSWNLDPTISSMLVMLDAIHDKFHGRGEWFGRLLDMDRPVITFMFMDLKKYRLTDELYVKMNSRGKQLTPFENFKAQYGQYLETVHIEGRNFSLTFNGREMPMTLKQYFSQSIDTRWTDLMWAYRNIDGEKNYERFDDKIANFIRTVFTFYYATAEYNSENFETLREDKLLPTFSRYKELGVISSESALFLIDAFNALCAIIDGNTGKLKRLMPADHPYDEKKAFENALRYNFDNYGEQMCLYAYLQYLIKFGSDAGLADWMRVIFNLTHPNNTPTNTQEDFAKGVCSIKAMLSEADHILDYHAADGKVVYFRAWQVEEEKIKACLLLRGGEWRNAITATEKHGYFTGQIGFILAFAGIADYYKSRRNCAWSDEEDDEYFRRFTDYAAKASAVFAKSYDNRVNDKNYCFERAVLTKGDYLLWVNGSRWNLLSSQMNKNNLLRDYSWRRALRLGDKDFVEPQRCVKAVLDDERFKAAAPTDTLEAICSDGSSVMWRDVLIRNPRMFDYSRQGFIVFYDENSIMLLKESQMNHYHVELFTYDLWLDRIEKDLDICFEKPDYGYCSVRTTDEWPGILLFYTYGRVEYEIFVTSRVEKKYIEEIGSDDYFSLKYFVVEFCKSRGNKCREDYSPEVAATLEAAGFNWHDSDGNSRFVRSARTKDDVQSLLHTLSRKLP